MNKYILLISLLAVSACADISKYSNIDSEATVKAKMRACLISEANSKFQAGSLFTVSISDTADELVATCTKKLALLSAGIGEESQSTAETIIKNLQNFNNAQ